MEKKCPNCSSVKLTKGIVRTNDAMNFCFVPQDESTKFFPKTLKVQAFVCEDCGYVSLFTADNKK